MGYTAGVFREPHEGASKNPKPALRRGDACLACRKRRIRCSAEKPVCATCARLNKVCIYEEARKPSQLSRLRDRVAELENQVKEAAEQSETDRRASDTEVHLSPNNPFEFVHQGGPFFGSYATPSHLHTPRAQGTLPAPANGHGAMPPPQPPPHPYYSVAQSTNPRPLQSPDSNFAFDFGLLDPAMMDLSSVLNSSTPFGDRSTPSFTPHHGYTGATGGTGGTGGSDPTLGVPELTPPESGTSGSLDSTSTPYLTNAVALPTATNPGPPNTSGSNVSGGWFDPDDVPPAVRDHLLDLFFSCKDVYETLFNVPRFYLRLTLPASRRPHPALLYTMYTIAARASSQPSLKALEARFFEIAQTRVYQGCTDGDRIMDLTKAFVLMTGYAYSVGKYNLGYVMAGSSIRLALSCGLHRIPSNVFVAPRKYHEILHIALRTGIHALAPPEDPIELAERINAFWAVYELDQCTSVAYLWDPGFRLTDIITPFPRPLEDYVSGLVSTTDDIRLDSLNDPDASKDQFQHSDFLTLRLKALTLLAQVTRMRFMPPEPGCLGARNLYDPRNLDRLSAGPRSAWESTPVAFKKMKAILDRFCSQLPAEHQAPWGQWDAGVFEPLPLKKVRRDTSVLWFLIGSAYLQLWNVRSLLEENATGVLVARRCVQAMASYTGERMYGGYDAFILSIWNDMGITLMREVKRLQVLGREDETFELRQDAAMVMDALMARQVEWTDGRLHAGAMHAQYLEKLWTTSNEDWVEAMSEADMRYG